MHCSWHAHATVNYVISSFFLNIDQEISSSFVLHFAFAFASLSFCISNIFRHFPTLIMSCCSIGSSASAFPAAQFVLKTVRKIVLPISSF